jgi:hypothetical protein
MTVEILRLSGLPAAEAEQTALQVLDHRTGPRDLRNLLVLDDTELLNDHAQVYVQLDSARRVEDLLCVAVGPLNADNRHLRLPGNLGGIQGAPVIWVSDPFGIDWRAAAAAIAIGHPLSKISGLDHLIELLSVEDIFKCVHMILIEKVPDRVASPGLLLAGAEDEAATFAAALAIAIRRLCDPGPGSSGPFLTLLPSQAGGATIVEGGKIARYRDDVAAAIDAASDALSKLTGLGGMFRHGNSEVNARVIEAGTALGDFRDLVARLLREASAARRLSDSQRRRVSEAGIRFLPGPEPVSRAETATEKSPLHQAVTEAIQEGETFVRVARRLTLTERELKRRGSASYLQDVDDRCPPPLLDLLADPPHNLPRRTKGTQARHKLGLDDALRATMALEDLVVTVANREWSTVIASREEVARIRVALDGVCKALTEHADAEAGTKSQARGARLARLGDGLTVVLRDLALSVLAAEYTKPSTGGQEVFGVARKRAAELLTEWASHVQANGVSSRPSFAASSAREGVLYTDENDLVEIRDALVYQPAEKMWQLCTPGDCGVLNVASVPPVVRFASRLSKDTLAGLLPGEEPVWTSSGSYAGLLRLIPLRPGHVSSTWGETPSADPS